MTTAPADTFRRATDAEPAPARQQLAGRLCELLAGKKIVMTGVTGFIGEQLLWKILTELPDTRAAVLVRRKGSATARDRVLALLRKPIFAEAREAAGGLEALLDARIDVIEGDLPDVPELPTDLDIVVHCAGDVSFDPPIDQAFTTNVVGTQHLMERMLAAVTNPDGTRRWYRTTCTSRPRTPPGRRRGAIPEAAHEHTVDYQEETAAGLRMREQIEAESRTPERLAALRKQAERRHRRAGFMTTAADTERRRLEWVEAELVRAGTERARSLGWTDVYTFTKALGERVVAELGAEIKISIVRPAIVESSWKHPYPGWIEGFKMAEPLILAYGKGELPEFPASPDSVIDIVPCDHVVNAIVAVCATEPKPGEPGYYHVSSGARNPLTFSACTPTSGTTSLEHPLENTAKPGKPLPEWRFPGAASIERLLSTSERAYTLADRVITHAPRSDRTRKLARDLDRFRGRLRFIRRYLSLYNEYAQSELHFVDDNTLALTRSLDPRDVDAFAFDTAVFDWKTYVQEVHTPSVVAPIRRMDALRNKRGSRPTTMKDLRADTAGASAVAIFDLDGTIMSTNVVEQYLWARLPELDTAGQLAEVAQVDAPAARLPAGRAEGPRQFPACGLPALPRDGPRRAGAPGRHHHGAGHPQPALARGAATDHRAPGRRAHHDPDHRRGAHLHPAAAGVLRRDRRRRAGGGRATAGAPATSRHRPWSASPGPRGSSTTPPCTASSCPAASRTRTPTRTCRCCPRWAIPSPSARMSR